MKTVAMQLLLLCCSVLALACQDNPKKQVHGMDGISIIDKEDVKTHVIGKEVQLVDVRTAEEFAAGHIGHAVNYNIIDSQTFLKQIERLDKNKPVYLYCKMGGRSNRAALLLKENGFTEIYDYSGGYNNWVIEN